MPEPRPGHVLLGVNVLVYGYIPAAWRTPLFGTRDFLTPGYWEQIGRLAERARLDAVFLADSLGLGDPAYDANPIRLDPFVVWAQVAGATERVGLIATASTTFNDPVDLAARILTLDQVSNGRAGWNLVTTRDDRSAANFGLERVVPRSQRYDRGAEFAELARALWSAAGTGRRVTHHGTHFHYDDEFRAPASPQGSPVLFQAGGSPGGRDIASRYADGVFTAEITLETAREHYRTVKDGAVRAGRRPGDVAIMPGLLLTLGSTEEEARRRVDELYESSPSVYSAAWLSHAIGVDVGALNLDEPFPDDVLRGPADPDIFTGSIGFRESILEQIRQTRPTVREYLRQTRYSGSGHGGFVGTPEQLADRIEHWYREYACDGFNLQPDVLLDSLEVIADEVIPLLRARGLYRDDYESSTLRGHFAAANPALAPPVPVIRP
ncbi:LLM class flavin-dependent oxidoreductase [Nocardia jinanensis]|uniref:Nitrilotriacetate monooxygenase component A n=1 Tax=Nocardia jinanensis TaxID=382504 RepID=A0A917RQM6_9NOCA|nr:LLM class flavin-dependent oxidoreductase [Nocardia jinanensis]GGL19498.1 nitrilotriacetate monooxygenase component A [Nocardia jinanensis]